LIFLELGIAWRGEGGTVHLGIAWTWCEVGGRGRLVGKEWTGTGSPIGKIWFGVGWSSTLVGKGWTGTSSLLVKKEWTETGHPLVKHGLVLA